MACLGMCVDPWWAVRVEYCYADLGQVHSADVSVVPWLILHCSSALDIETITRNINEALIWPILCWAGIYMCVKDVVNRCVCFAIYVCWDILYSFAGTFVKRDLTLCTEHASKGRSMQAPKILIFTLCLLVVMTQQLYAGAVLCMSL